MESNDELSHEAKPIILLLSSDEDSVESSASKAQAQVAIDSAVRYEAPSLSATNLNNDLIHLNSLKSDEEGQEGSNVAGRTRRKCASTSGRTPFWRDVSGQDSFLVDTPRRCSFIVQGNPLPLQRIKRSKYGNAYNPSGPSQRSFQAVVRDILHAKGNRTSMATPLFANEESLIVTIVFRMRRPLSHFVNRTRGHPLCPDAPGQVSLTRPDIDNLAKFVLDSLNGIIYADDHQIVALKLVKILDSFEECNGSTEVSVQVIGEDEMRLVLAESQNVSVTQQLSNGRA
jgi:Holliday junction resolvase RusA-like endonuclease